MLYASPGPDSTTIGLLMIGNTLPGLTSFVFNGIQRMHVYEYGDNINNPYWIIHPVCQQGTVQSGGASVMFFSAATFGFRSSTPVLSHPQGQQFNPSLPLSLAFEPPGHKSSNP
ncbi:hypothetical protein AVEN_40837-1 [Araneus ventricosus]|uniref:Uncharacterized protein n=1 Tax=Araneus ventricosus TaxID=182803 RepID=A0A4Y2CEB6_ARAVE|nr:hypothetical protein AVEN_40837-1 [Araneus ventricosus]